ncbi:unnamed protein product [Urochloa humidicola]
MDASMLPPQCSDSATWFLFEMVRVLVLLADKVSLKWQKLNLLMSTKVLCTCAGCLVMNMSPGDHSGLGGGDAALPNDDHFLPGEDLLVILS